MRPDPAPRRRMAARPVHQESGSHHNLSAGVTRRSRIKAMSRLSVSMTVFSCSKEQLWPVSRAVTDCYSHSRPRTPCLRRPGLVPGPSPFGPSGRSELIRRKLPHTPHPSHPQLLVAQVKISTYLRMVLKTHASCLSQSTSVGSTLRMEFREAKAVWPNPNPIFDLLF